MLDQEREKLYLALWDRSDLHATAAVLNKKISNKYGGNVYINSVKHLKYEDYLLGIKLNHESIRNTFRGVV